MVVSFFTVFLVYTKGALVYTKAWCIPEVRFSRVFRYTPMGRPDLRFGVRENSFGSAKTHIRGNRAFRVFTSTVPTANKAAALEITQRHTAWVEKNRTFDKRGWRPRKLQSLRGPPCPELGLLILERRWRWTGWVGANGGGGGERKRVKVVGWVRDWLACCLVGCLPGSQAAWLPGWLAGWLLGWLACWHANWLVGLLVG